MHIAIVCRGLGAGGSVAAVALRQARELARHARVTVISDSLPEDLHGLEAIRVRVPDFHALRRLRHVPDEVAFARAARIALQKIGSSVPRSSSEFLGVAASAPPRNSEEP